MVACTKCESMNSVDSAFCKKCGAALPDDELLSGRQKLEDLLKDGYSIFNEGRTEEALMVAEAVLLSNPGSASAFSLKGMCHERKGDLGDALECYEHVVEMNPDSALDKIKVNQLRNKLALPAQTDAATGNRKLALAGAAATLVLVLALGAVFGSINARAEEKTAKDMGKVDQGLSEPLRDVPQDPKKEETQVQKPGAEQPVDEQVQQPVGAQQQHQGQLPPAPGNGREETIPPISLGNISVTQDGPKLPNPTNQNKPGPTNNTRRDPDPEPRVEPKQEDPKDTGVYDIKISGGGSTRTTGGGTEPVANDGNRAQALLKTADTKFMLQRYGEAAATYESALQAGASPGKCNQRLGDCYKHLGQKEAAIAAYSRAASSYEAGGNARAAATCRQALKDLQGG
jgi:hypothetical protein